MNAFYQYFLSYVFRARTRQGLLFLAVAGLFLSSLSLLVIQGVMGGLQNGLIARSKNINGVGVIRFEENEFENFKKFKARGWKFTREVEMEILARAQGHVAPMVIHGIDSSTHRPDFLENKDLSGVILGVDLAQKLKTSFFHNIKLIAPSSTTAMAGEVPRQLSSEVSDYLLSEVQEIDQLHAWTRIGLVQNLLRVREANRWRFFNQQDYEDAQLELKGYEFVSWEEDHKTLMWALGLETKVMLVLFISMSLLVAFSITTALFLFFTKIRQDLASFWLLGYSLKKINRLLLTFIVQLSGMACLLGVILGVGLLFVLERYGHVIVPDIFVERTFPVHISFITLLSSFCIPYLIAIVFSFFSFQSFRKDNPDFIQLVRGASEN